MEEVTEKMEITLTKITTFYSNIEGKLSAGIEMLGNWQRKFGYLKISIC